MQKLTMLARAKINLSLNVLNRREDGYHNIQSLMQRIDFGDDVTVELTEKPEIRLDISGLDLSAGPENIAWRAAALMKDTYQIKHGFLISLTKRIPVAAGLAGGSADAAAVMKLIDKLCGLAATESDLASLGLSLGADIPFCLHDGPALAEGIGERLTPAAGLKDCYIVLVNPGIALSTAMMYQALDREKTLPGADINALQTYLRAGALFQAFREMKNVMEPVARQLCPDISSLLEKLYLAGADHAMMSGSGATCFGIFVNEPDRGRLADLFGSRLVALTCPVYDL